jgi:hypothetical protein
MTEQQVSQEETAELKTAAEWQLRPQMKMKIRMKMKEMAWEIMMICPWPKIFAAEETATTEPATGAAGPRDRGHQKADVEISADYQRREAG